MAAALHYARKASFGLSIFITVCGASLAARTMWRGHLEDSLLRTPPDVVLLNPTLLDFSLNIGQSAYAEYCSGCHRAGQGDSAIGVPGFIEGAWLYGSGEIYQIERSITHGIRSGDPRGHHLADMPAYAQPVPYTREKIDPLTPDDIDDVTEFVLAFAKSGKSPAARRGEDIYRGRGGCQDCHGGDGRGDSAIGAPDLVGPVHLWGNGSRATLIESISRGHAGVCPAFQRRLSPATIRALAFYLFTMAGKRRAAHQLQNR